MPFAIYYFKTEFCRFHDSAESTITDTQRMSDLRLFFHVVLKGNDSGSDLGITRVWQVTDTLLPEPICLFLSSFIAFTPVMRLKYHAIKPMSIFFCFNPRASKSATPALPELQVLLAGRRPVRLIPLYFAVGRRGGVRRLVAARLADTAGAFNHLHGITTQTERRPCLCPNPRLGNIILISHS